VAIPALLAALALLVVPAPSIAAEAPDAGAQETPAPAAVPVAAPAATPATTPAATPTGAPAAGAAAADHPVGPEDLLEINVFEIPDLNRTVRVSERGTVSLPLLGEMSVKGLTATELEQKLRVELGRKYVKNPQVSVFIREYGSKRVSVIGAVGKPGVYEMLGPRTLLQILSQAGGLNEDVGAELYVIRGTPDGASRKVEIPVADLMSNRDPSLNVPIQPGDVISVPVDRPIYVYVDGAVHTPGRIEQLASRPITLMQAIAKAGGATDRANMKAVQILRREEGGTQQAIEVNLKKLRKGKEPDPVLRDGDIVVVPETFF
jgi:polysaccharide biosynthesis/export protein